MLAAIWVLIVMPGSFIAPQQWFYENEQECMNMATFLNETKLDRSLRSYDCMRLHHGQGAPHQ